MIAKEMAELAGNFEDAGPPRRNTRPCRAVTLTAWVTLLTCIIIVFQVVIGFMNTLIKNEQFWAQTNEIIETYASRFGCAGRNVSGPSD